jgi:uncharacterized protein YndB with AHSA1/START domain
MNDSLVAKSSVTIAAPPDRVWDALVDPRSVKQYMLGADVASDWRKGSPITWSGEWKGKGYQDKGVVLAVHPGRRLQYSHFSPLAGLPDKPENYHTVTIELAQDGERTKVALSQDKNPTPEAKEHSEENWDKILAGLKKVVEAS